MNLELATMTISNDEGGNAMVDMDKEIARLEHELAQLERGTTAVGGIDVLGVTKAGFRRRIAGLKQLQAQARA